MLKLDFEQKIAWKIMTKFPVEVEIPGHPETTNSIWRKKRGGGFYKSSKAKNWESISSIKIRTAARMLYGMYDLSWAKGLGFELDISFIRNTWRGKSKEKSGLYVRPDMDNFLKNALDSICGALNLDDSAVVKLTASKKEEPGDTRTRARILFLEV